MRKKSITIVYQNCWWGIYANNKLLKKLGPNTSQEVLNVIMDVLVGANVELIQATAPYIKGCMLPDDLKKLIPNGINYKSHKS